VGKRLIIQHGERITRHELTERALVIGRDPSCDLFFADQKLSRRHARVEPGARGVRLTDLGSRNGSWVNDQRVDEWLLQPDDKIRLGRLQITIEEDLPIDTTSAAGGDATVLLSEGGIAEEAGKTVRLDLGEQLPERSSGIVPPDDTVLFKETPKPDRDRTVVLSGASPPGEDSGTVIFQSPSGARPDTTTRAAPTLEPTQPAIEREESGGRLAEDLAPEAVGVVVEPGADIPTDEVARRVDLSPLVVMAVFSIAAYLFVACPLIFTTRTSLRQESLARGRVLLDLLAAQNEAALATGDQRALSVDSVLEESGVEDAFILDVDGRVLAPGSRSGESFGAIEGVSKKVGEIDRFVMGRTSAGDINLVRPIFPRGNKVGLAVVRYSGARIAEGKAVPVLVLLGLVLIALGVGSSYFLFKKTAAVGITTETTLAEGPEPIVTDVDSSMPDSLPTTEISLDSKGPPET
jgi:pSer/pThr/pTyr-binding forkhead associated (FHA) protein